VFGLLSTSGLKQPLSELDEARPDLRGLEVMFDSPGGNSLASGILERSILKTKQAVPVVSYVMEACSGAVLPSVAGHLVFGHREGEFGGFGAVLPVCDGHVPKTVVSRQSPRKWENGAQQPPRLFVRDEGLQDVELMLSLKFEEDLKVLNMYRQRPPAALRPFLDGRPLNSAEALEAGLIDAVSSPAAAYGKLLDLVKG
jgi:hypothetical protein